MKTRQTAFAFPPLAIGLFAGAAIMAAALAAPKSVAHVPESGLAAATPALSGHRSSAGLAGGDEPPFGGPEDVAFAGRLWQVLSERNFVGDGAILTRPYEGQEPHGAILEYIENPVTVDGTTGLAIVKKNYGGEGANPDSVMENRGKYLKSVTVMFKREPGYDPDHQDWFWVKYGPDGKPLTNPKDMKLAGRVAKGMDKGCIACHSAAPGDDYLFTYDR